MDRKSLNASHPVSDLPTLDQAGLRAFLAAQPDVVAVYLFGSLAEGRAAPGSDVDIAVLLRDDADAAVGGERHLALMGDLERFADRKVDVVMLNTASPILQQQVLQHGRLLYEGDRRARVEFEVRAGKIYADLKPMYDYFARALLQEIREVGLGGRRRRHLGTTDPAAQRSGLPENREG